jgi:ribosomal protein L11 methyltransferase
MASAGVSCMPLYKLRIEATHLDAGRKAADLLGEPPAPAALAITVFELRLPAFVVEAYYDHEPSLAAVQRVLTEQRAELGTPALEAVPDLNWVALSQAALPPIRAGRFIVHGSHDRSRFTMRRLAIEIEAGEAFGTGYNATTALCLGALDTLVRRRRFARVLDLGCGSGLLAIAAARALPGARVHASDNDLLAINIVRDNTRLNRVEQRVRTISAAGFDHAALRAVGSFDLVLANILPGPLIELAPAMRRAIMPGGIAVLSGLLTHHVRQVAATYRSHGFRLLHCKESAGWAALVLINTRS